LGKEQLPTKNGFGGPLLALQTAAAIHHTDVIVGRLLHDDTSSKDTRAKQ